MEWLLDFLKTHGSQVGWIVVPLVPLLWGIYQARRQWKTREFMSRFSISLNMLRPEGDGMVLWLPAAEEFQLEEVFHRNQTAVRIVRKAAYATTPDEPFMVTIPADDRMSILNEVANRVEVIHREGSFAVMAGLPVQYLTLVIGLTCEKGADVRIRKIRALAAEEGLLFDIDRIMQTRLEKPHHAVRRQTLCRMARLYADHPGHFARIRVALRVPVAISERVPRVAVASSTAAAPLLAENVRPETAVTAGEAQAPPVAVG
jgi:hypothetical protein